MLKVILAGNVALASILGYGLYSVNGTQKTLDERIAALESTTKKAQTESEKKLTNLSSDFDQMNKKVGVTTAELTHARETAQALKKQQEQSSKELATQLATKANSTDVDTLRQEASTKMDQLQQDSNAKLGAVSGDVNGIKQDLKTTREDLNRQLV